MSDADKSKEQKVNLRKKFFAKDGIKHLFNLKIMKVNANSEELSKIDLDLHFKDKGSPISKVENLMIILFNNKQSMVLTYENYVKQLMFIQYKQNCKRETKKDISEFYKPVLDSLDAVSAQSPKASKKTKQTQLKKGKSDKKDLKKT